MYIVIWDVLNDEQRHAQSFESRWEAFFLFQELCSKDNIYRAQVEKDNGYCLHHYQAN